MKTTARLLLILASIAYPLLWYLGRERGIFPWLAAAMCLLWAARAIIQQDRAQKTVSALIALFFALLLASNSTRSMYWYPVLVNALMFILFFASLFARQTLIERLARLTDPELPPEAIAYTRKVTQVWCAFFIVNGSIAAWLAALASHRAWALYTGIIAYGLMGVLFAGEYLLRRRLKKRVT
ncbi:MAG: hypothetical protein Q4D61_03130 [Cardiobacteriaceae bacterium]|nr:hypothetical protein [Cardiobacteriaceae bacterium]